MATMQDILSHVEAQDTVEDGVITMLQQISQQLKDAQAQNDPQAVQNIINRIDANTKKLSDAVAANTPADPTAPALPQS